MITRFFPAKILAVAILPVGVGARLAGAQVSSPDLVYHIEELVSDQQRLVGRADPRLINPMGMAFNPSGPFSIVSNGQGSCLAYTNEGVLFPTVEFPRLIVIPSPIGGQQSTMSRPTAVVVYEGADFVIRNAEKFGPSRLIFATETGSILGWSPQVDSTKAIQMADYSPVEAVYTGLTLAMRGDEPFLLATNFHAGTVEVFDRRFRLQAVAEAFRARDIPREAAPFGIHLVRDDLYVTYASRDNEKRKVVPGAGKGMVAVFDLAGQVRRTLASGGPLDAPYAVVRAPERFGAFSDALLVGNHGDGRIHAFNRETGELLGPLRDREGRPLQIEGLWSLAVRKVAVNDPLDPEVREESMLYFTSGPGQGRHGVFGRIRPGPPRLEGTPIAPSTRPARAPAIDRPRE